MKSLGESTRKIEEAFEAVHRNQAETHVSPAWEDDAMQAIRRLASQPSRYSFDLERTGQLVWRFTAATCLFALSLGLYAVLSDLGTASEITRSFFADPLGIDMLHTLGVI
jgi:hypothetical protein